MDKRVYNFSPGPAMLPVEVLEQARKEMHSWHGTGMSVTEISHRGPEFEQISQQAELDLRDLMKIPPNYKVLFLQGGATGQFAAIPLNLAKQSDRADYVITGIWGQKAYEEAKKYLDKAHIAYQTHPHTYVPLQKEWSLSKSSAYVHITPNETIHGVAFTDIPNVDPVPLVADVSPIMLGVPIDVKKFGVLYGGAQKNVGPAGLTVVIVRDDLLDKARVHTPTIWHWQAKAQSNSALNTPPVFSWYLAGLVFKWLKKLGGVNAIHKINQQKAAKLYKVIDGSGFYHSPVEKKFRSIINIPFTLSNPELEPLFLQEASKAGLKYLEGHRSVGGMRASLYNAMPMAGVDALTKFMKEFEKRNG